MRVASTRPRSTAWSTCAASTISPKRWPSRATTSSRSPRQACATAWAGSAFRKGGIVLDMRGFNKIVLNESARSITVQPGATWHDIQNVLHPRFAVRAMQSTDIFSVGGSISVNAHGMDHQAGALAKSIKSMKVMLADGSLQTVSATENDGPVQPRGRRLRPVRRHRRGRARYRRQPGLPDRAPHDGLQGVSGAVRRRDREGRQYRPDVWPPLDGARARS